MLAGQDLGWPQSVNARSLPCSWDSNAGIAEVGVSEARGVAVVHQILQQTKRVDSGHRVSADYFLEFF